MLKDQDPINTVMNLPVTRRGFAVVLPAAVALAASCERRKPQETRTKPHLEPAVSPREQFLSSLSEQELFLFLNREQDAQRVLKTHTTPQVHEEYHVRLEDLDPHVTEGNKDYTKWVLMEYDPRGRPVEAGYLRLEYHPTEGKLMGASIGGSLSREISSVSYEKYGADIRNPRETPYLSGEERRTGLQEIVQKAIEKHFVLPKDMSKSSYQSQVGNRAGITEVQQVILESMPGDPKHIKLQVEGPSGSYWFEVKGLN